MTAHDNKHEQGGFYKLALQTARRKADLPKDQFQVLLLRLLGNKDHEKVFDIVCKVEKRFEKVNPRMNSAAPYERESNRKTKRCFYCQKPGHFQVHCFLKKKHEKQQNAREEQDS